MNRKQRRAAHGQSPPAGSDAGRQLLAPAPRSQQKHRLAEAARAQPTPLQIAVLAAYPSLSASAHATRLLERNFPPALAEVVSQHPREPNEERALPESTPRVLRRSATKFRNACASNTKRAPIRAGCVPQAASPR